MVDQRFFPLVKKMRLSAIGEAFNLRISGDGSLEVEDVAGLKQRQQDRSPFMMPKDLRIKRVIQKRLPVLPGQIKRICWQVTRVLLFGRTILTSILPS